MIDQRAADRGEHDLGGRRRRARDVHAGRLRVPRGRPDAHEERGAHRRQERARSSRVCSLVYWAVGFGIAFGDGGNGSIGDAAASSRRSTAARGRPGAVRVLQRDSRRGGLFVRGRVRRRLARDRLGRDGRAREALGVLRLRRRLHAHLLGRLALDLARRRLAVRARHAGLRRLDGGALPGRARRARRRDPARAAHRQVRHGRARRTRSPAQHARSP